MKNIEIIELQKEQEQIDQQLLNAGCMSEGAVNPYKAETLTISPDEFERLEKEIDRLTNLLLRGSTELEKMKNERDFLNKCLDMVLVDAQKERAFLDVFLDEQEAIWDRTKELASPEIAVHYLAAAQHRRNQGRTGDRINEIQNWIDNS